MTCWLQQLLAATMPLLSCWKLVFAAFNLFIKKRELGVLALPALQNGISIWPLQLSVPVALFHLLQLAGAWPVIHPRRTL